MYKVAFLNSRETGEISGVYFVNLSETTMPEKYYYFRYKMRKLIKWVIFIFTDIANKSIEGMTKDFWILFIQDFTT